MNGQPIPYDAHEVDRLRDECGVFAVFGHVDAAAHTALGLHALQHRGQESAGIVSYDQGHFNTHRGLGLVGDTFSSPNVMERLTGRASVGHVRYSTTGGTILRNVQPLFAEFSFGGLAIAHNGNFTNGYSLRRALVKRGSIFQSTTDTEVLIHLMATSSYHAVEDRMIDALRQVEGAYSMVALTNDTVFGVRDPLGVRPLVIGSLDGATVLASETCALDIIGAKFVRDVRPGELVVIDSEGLHSVSPFPPAHHRFCVFEYIYFARPDSVVEGSGVYEVRKNIGTELAREAPVEADMVVPVPDSGTPGAMGYAVEAGLPFDLGIIRNHYVGRTFIEPTDQIRHLGVRLKHNANRANIAGKRIVLVDDSIVRGTTSTKIVEMMREAGAAEVHMRIASPPITDSCYYGVDTPEKDKLLAARLPVEDIADEIGVDSLVYLSIDGLYRATTGEVRNSEAPQFCDACLTGDYPIRLIDQEDGDIPAQLSLLTEQV
ncbi:MAG: amidophosphoribosyltransferase [Alphaproteobacteria bacterium]|nr:amidophosphoribosyltransferase [Alphaproteobacteria bacterium]|tara:strand:+ start:6183 stop:7649 length:1467 start_codon:yes stop_codon:yes gene_type:complete